MWRTSAQGRIHNGASTLCDSGQAYRRVTSADLRYITDVFDGEAHLCMSPINTSGLTNIIAASAVISVIAGVWAALVAAYWTQDHLVAVKREKPARHNLFSDFVLVDAGVALALHLRRFPLDRRLASADLRNTEHRPGHIRAQVFASDQTIGRRFNGWAAHGGDNATTYAIGPLRDQRGRGMQRTSQSGGTATLLVKVRS
jgi:hypothetical protein